MRRRLLLAVGIVLIAAGAVAVGFFAKAVWLRDGGTGSAQERLAEDFEQSQAAGATTTAVTDDPVIATNAGTSPTSTVVIPTTTIANLVVEEPPPHGAAVGRIIIPAAGVDWVMVEGVTLDDLAAGPGHMPGTAMPGQPGNAVISGHRTTHGAPFFRLDSLNPGNRITVETLIGTHVYEVVEVRIVAPDAIWVTGDAEGAWLTLTTCNPLYRSIERLVVFARLIEGPNLAAIEAGLDGDPRPPQPPAG